MYFCVEFGDFGVLDLLFLYDCIFLFRENFRFFGGGRFFLFFFCDRYFDFGVVLFDLGVFSFELKLIFLFFILFLEDSFFFMLVFCGREGDFFIFFCKGGFIFNCGV